MTEEIVLTLNKSLALLASGLILTTAAGCQDVMFTTSKPGTSLQAEASDAHSCGASSFLGGAAIDRMDIPEFSQCMRSKGYTFHAP